MSRQVDLDKPISAEDKEYLLNRGHDAAVAWNEQRFAESGNSESLESEKADPLSGFDPDDVAYVTTLKPDELKSALVESDLSNEGEIVVLQVRLLEHLAEIDDPEDD